LDWFVCRVESGSILPNLTTARPYALYGTKKFFSLDSVKLEVRPGRNCG
jgi:hypothetical protein